MVIETMAERLLSMMREGADGVEALRWILRKTPRNLLAHYRVAVTSAALNINIARLRAITTRMKEVETRWHSLQA